MIEILITRDVPGNITGIRVEGHSGYEDEGKDIVCSAVSAIVQTAVLGINNVIGLKPFYHQEKGLAELRISSKLLENNIRDLGIILETMLLGLKSIELGYSEYITIRERKVE